MSGLLRERPEFAEESSRLARATSVYTFRRRRTAIFADLDLFGEPAYDILLDLYIAHHQGRQVTISDACNATDAAWTTALRRLRMLQDQGFVRRTTDHIDRRRC